MFDAIKGWFREIADDFVNNFITGSRWKWLLEGLKNTIIISLLAVLIGVVIGVVVASVRSTYDKNGAAMKLRGGFGYKVFSFFNWLCNLYLTVIRGTPMVVQLLIMYFIVFASSTNGLMVAVISFGINSGAYLAEIFRGGIMSVDAGQFEAGRALGFNYFQTMIYIIIPQMFKIVLPTLCNEFIALIKETSILSYIALTELTKAGDYIRSRTYSAFTPYIISGLLYLLVTIVLTKLIGRLERRLSNSDH